MTTTDDIDAFDYTTLLAAVLKQGIDDYIKLQHPKHRRKKYLYEEYLNSIDMFFDPTYRFAHFFNDDDNEMSLLDLLSEITQDTNCEIDKLQNYLVEESYKYWEDKDMKVLHIPETVQVLGHVYKVHHKSNEEHYELDLDNKIIYLNKQDDLPLNQRVFLLAVLQLIAHHRDIKLSKAALAQLSTGLYSVLKMNDCFLIHGDKSSEGLL